MINYDDELIHFFHAMESSIGISRRVGLDTVPNVHTYSTSTPVSQL